MNTLPSMDRHIQQTNDRLLCIKQVGIKSPLSATAPTWTREESAFALLSCTPFSSQRLIWASVFLAISSSHTDHVAQGHRERGGERRGGGREREREANLAANTRRDFKGGEQHNSRPPPLGPVLPYITFLTLDARWPLLWFFSLNASASCQLSGGSFTDGYR